MIVFFSKVQSMGRTSKFWVFMHSRIFSSMFVKTLIKMLKIGEFNSLNALRSTSVGYYLGDDEGREVLLPNKYVPEDLKVDDNIEVFLYKDSEDRLIATTLIPKIKLNEFAFLKVKANDNIGTFLDWGLEKDLLVPYREQKYEMHNGQSYVVFMYLDKASGRLVASNNIGNHLNNRELLISVNDEVEILVFQQTDLGYNVIINQRYKGLVYNDEIFQPISIGSTLKGFVKKIRENNLVDISLQAQGASNILPSVEVILKELEKNDGFLPVNDKTDPEIIYDLLKMSKKSFKKALGSLYKDRKVKIDEKGIYKN